MSLRTACVRNGFRLRNGAMNERIVWARKKHTCGKSWRRTTLAAECRVFKSQLSSTANGFRLIWTHSESMTLPFNGSSTHFYSTPFQAKLLCLARVVCHISCAHMMLVHIFSLAPIVLLKCKAFWDFINYLIGHDCHRRCTVCFIRC